MGGVTGLVPGKNGRNHGFIWYYTPSKWWNRPAIFALNQCLEAKYVARPSALKLPGTSRNGIGMFTQQAVTYNIISTGVKHQ